MIPYLLLCPSNAPPHAVARVLFDAGCDVEQAIEILSDAALANARPEAIDLLRGLAAD